MNTHRGSYQAWRQWACTGIALAALLWGCEGRGQVQTVSGSVQNKSKWTNLGMTPPGDGGGTGALWVGIWDAESELAGPPAVGAVAATGALPLPYLTSYPYTLTPVVDGTYQLVAWVDGNADGGYDSGEPRSLALAVAVASNSPAGLNLIVLDDADADGMVDWWEAHWFGDAETSDGTGDQDRDGLTDTQEYTISRNFPALAVLDPTDWDTDGDLMDDAWEWARYLGGSGLSPVVYEAYEDADGDGLANLQEYNGVDGKGLLAQDTAEPAGVARSTGSTDDLDVFSVDTDSDGLIDSFEAAWYDTASGIDPLAAGSASADPDRDGLSNYREQCLLAELRQGGVNDIWTAGPISLPTADALGRRVFSPPLPLSPFLFPTVYQERFLLRGHEWTDPGHGSSFPLEGISRHDGWDSDSDFLPDGWEVEFGLNARSAAGPNGFYGDPDNDTLVNLEEYWGQDGARSEEDEYVVGSGDETSPNEHNWRPLSTVAGTGISRPPFSTWWTLGAGADGTLGAALPTVSLGSDPGTDADDDGLADSLEIQVEYDLGTPSSSPVHSMHPFIRRAALITSSAGVTIPDPEGSALFGYRPDFPQRTWTLETHVMIRTEGRSGDLVHIPAPRDLAALGESCTLSLSNDIPVLSFRTLGAKRYVISGLKIPTNRWTHIAGVWDPDDNQLGLYLDGIFVQEARITQEAASSWPDSCAESPVIGRSPPGPACFSNELYMDEVRIWSVARTPDELEAYRQKLVPPGTAGLLAYYRFDDGGTTAEDFVRRAVSGLLRAPVYAFGDHGFGLRTNGFVFVSDQVADVHGSDPRGADDSDGDGMSDGWELVNHLDPLSADGVDGADGHADGDRLSNLYEYWSDTNPQADDTDMDGTLDSFEDMDGDTLPNIIEEAAGSRPDIVDTDDDGLTDSEELAGGSSPVWSTDPMRSRCVVLGGEAGSYLDVPLSSRQRLGSWTLEGWVNPASFPAGDGILIRRAVQKLASGAYAANFILGVETNAGALRPYAGYVWTDGTAWFVKGSPIPTGQWTHVAASYDGAAKTMVLYTNGAADASRVDPIAPAPPTNGKGGDAFVRMGEDLAGSIDEVRVWSRALTAGEIADIFDTTVDGDEPGLVHCFRFDDGQANESAQPFSPYHQPQGAEDFTYPEDWSDEWLHSARLTGSASFAAPGALIAPPSIRVTLQPAAAVTAGARWSLDGGQWLESGQIIQNLDRRNLEHYIGYKSLDGWSAPTNEFVTVTNGELVSLVRTYRQNGSLTVTLEPAGARAAGAQWRLDGGEPQGSGTTLSNVAAGAHTISFTDVGGWITPSPQSVTVNEGLNTSLVAFYTEIRGRISIIIKPDGAAAGGAQWRLDGAGSWYASGAVAGNLQLGAHTVEFSDTPPWIKPASLTLTLTDDSLVTATGTYKQVTGLFVMLQPLEVVSSGALWRVASGVWTNSGVLMELGAGTYTVEFSDVAGWATPPPRSVTVATETTTFVTGAYYRVEILGTPGTNMPGMFVNPRGMALDASHALYVADSDNHRIQIRDPLTGTWSTLGSFGTRRGQFNQPFDVAFDAAGNLYVADANNNRIQRRNSGGGEWTAWGGPSIGTAVGQFNGPFGIAVDSRTNLYVADHYNHRIQKRSPSGAWSVFVSNGFADGYVRSPRGVAVDHARNVYVADYDAQGMGRVQKFAPNGTLLDVLVSSITVTGAVSRPSGLDIGSGGGVFVADTDNNRIITNQSSGAWDAVLEGGFLSHPFGVAVDSPLGYLYIADTGNGRVLRILLSDAAKFSPYVSALVLPGKDGVEIQWQGFADRFYTIRYADGAADPEAWLDLPGCTGIPGVDGLMSRQDTTAAGVAVRFYRVWSY